MTDKKALVPVQHGVVSIVQNQIKITEKIMTSLVHNTCENNKYDISCLTNIRQAAEQGDVNAQYSLGQIYRKGEGVSRDYAKAVKWYRKAAEQGYADAQFKLGVMYHNGKGVPQDDAEAVKWYRKAAEQGNSYAQRNIGVMYHNGKGVKQDTTEAVKWYRKAAEQGNADLELHDFFKSKNSQPTNVQSDEKQPKKVLTPKQYAVIKKILLQRLRRKGILPKDNQPQKKKS